jgi:predicted nucleotidyltransferase
MPSDSLRSLARHLDVPERTLRRAAAEGLVHGRRTSARRYETSLREEAYLRRHWPLLRELRDALRTEPSVRLAVLFGSQATGTASERSDVDLLVALTDPSAARVAQLTGRLERRLGRDVQLVRLQDAERTPSLMADALEQGRVLVDRDGEWPALKSGATTWRRRADADDVPLERAMPDLELS